MKKKIIEILEKHQLKDSTEEGPIIHPLISFTEYEKIADEIIKIIDCNRNNKNSFKLSILDRYRINKL